MRPLSPLPDWVSLEHSVAHILSKQELHGWYFDEPAAWELESSLRKELEELSRVLRNRHTYIGGASFSPKRSNKRTGYIEGAEFTRLKELNPTSRDHAAWILTTHYGWTPSSISSNGKPVVDEIVLKDIGTDIALDFLRCLELKKALGMISEGVNAWPNLAQVPADEKFRKLFKASPNMVMCGADLSGIELRVLSHYLAKYDDGRYADILINGDIHQVNADKIGITRRAVKTVTYAFLYGASATRIGKSYDKQLSDNKAAAKGKEIRDAFIKAIPGLSELLSAVKKRATTGKILAIDGRSLLVDSPHKALNFLLQGSAASIAKRWLVIADETIKQAGLHAHQLAFIHDEIQYECAQKHIDDMRFTLEHSAVRAGEYYNLRVPIAAEAKSGNNWSEVH